MRRYQCELAKAADTLARELFTLKSGETLVITADTESDAEVVHAAAAAAFAAGAKPMVIWLASPSGVGRAADSMLPVEALTGALVAADAWVEFNNKWLLYSTPYERAVKENPRLRYLCLPGMDVDMMVRLVGQVDYPRLAELLERVTSLTASCRHMRWTTAAGTNVEFDMSSNPDYLLACDVGFARSPGQYMLGGQVGWPPVLESINGDVVFDGSLNPPCGKLGQLVKLKVKGGVVKSIDGGTEAEEFRKWLESFDDERMFHIAHVCWGFHPGARLTGNVLEDERVWGATEWGLGHIGSCVIAPDGIPAASHTDGVCLNTSAWLDGKQFLDRGCFVDKKLSELASQLGKA
jgi:leucyl aminopeptidase (aminopeptidase T)